MIIPSNLIELSAQKTKKFVEQYMEHCHRAGEIARSETDLYWMVLGEYGKPILIRELNIPARDSRVHGLLLTYTDRYEIHLLNKAPFQKRYTTCKELFQIILYQENLNTTDIIDLVENMILRSSPESSGLDLGHPTVSESLGEICAMEFLFPYGDRLRHIESINGKEDVARLATDYKIPQYLIERYLSPAMMHALMPFFGDKGSEIA